MTDEIRLRQVESETELLQWVRKAGAVTEDLTFIEYPMHPTDWDSLGHFRGVAEGNRIR